jgi:Fur family transcriptional regulator, ferric uptake regulator
MTVHVDLDDLLQQLRSRGGRVTTARRVVLADLVRRGSAHPTADQIARRVGRSHPELHLSTIYRTLEALEGLGLVTRASFGEGATTYHLAADRHHHAVCESCGAVIELPDAALAPVVRRLARDHGFAARPRHLTIAGLCADCSDRSWR